jgi:methyl-accepting chemotaxis protein
MILDFLQNIRNRLVGAPIGATLSVILLLGLVPAVVMGSYYVNSSYDNIRIAEQELAGVRLLREIQPVEDFINNPPDDIEAMKKKAGASWNILNQAKRRNNQATAINSTSQFDRALSELRVKMSGGKGDPRQAFDALITRIGDQSGLILDPELESYYLMDMVLMKARKLSRTAEEYERVALLSAEQDSEMLSITRFRLRDAARELQLSALSAIKGNTNGTLSQSNLMPAVNETIAAGNAMLAGIDVASDHDRLVEANKKSWVAAADALDRALLARIDRINSELFSALAVCGCVIIIAVLLAGLVIVTISGTLSKLSQRLDELSLGDYESEIPGTELNNDIGVIANALQNFVGLSGAVEDERNRAKHELEATVAQVKRENDSLMQKALTQQAESQVIERQAVSRLAAQLESQMMGLLSGSRSAAMQMDREAGMMAESTTGVQRGASTAARAANEIRLSVEGVAPEVKAVADQLQNYTQSLGEAKDLAKDAVKRVDVAKDRIAEFDSATKRAGAMLELITSVAHKTNMLALNASIEAVRVGEAGQGFMVVAEEVKALAKSTRDAAHDINDQIKAMEGANSAVASAFGEVLETVNILATQSETVANGMQGQTIAISQVNNVISNASSELSTMVHSIDGADKSASIAIARSSEMLAASKSVSDSVDILDKSVREFLGGIQSAQQQAA